MCGCSSRKVAPRISRTTDSPYRCFSPKVGVALGAAAAGRLIGTEGVAGGRDDGAEAEARRLAQDVALAVQAALLYRSAPASVFGAFCDSRLGGDWGDTFGTLGAGADLDGLLTRALPT